MPVGRVELRSLLAERELPARGGYAVTASLRSWFGAGDGEELEHAATWRAATAECVLPVEVPEAMVRDHGTAQDPGAVELVGPIKITDVAAVLMVDDDDLVWYGVQEADMLAEAGGS